jgi:uncharacterized protein (TIGR03083 family)
VDVQPLLVAARRSLLTTFEELRGDQWEANSLCEGWRVRDVLAHLTLAARPAPPPVRYLRAIARARGSFHVANRELAIADGSLPPDELVERFRSVVESKRIAPPGSMRLAPFADAVIHSLDVRVPLGIETPVPSDHHVITLEFLLRPLGRFFGGAGRPGTRWVATDHDWSSGAGPEVRGTLVDLLLTLAGRDARAGNLEGDGATAVRNWFR